MVQTSSRSHAVTKGQHRTGETTATKSAVKGCCAFLLMVMLGACGTPRDFTIYQESIGEFQSATDRTASVALDYVQSINTFERGYELKLLREDPSRQLNISKLSEPILSPQALAARDRAFGILKQYTQMLAALAESDVSERWKSASERAKISADTLLTDLNADSGILGSLPIGDITSPLKVISDTIATEILNAKRSTALDAAITKAAPAIQEISAKLREDLAFVVRQRDSVKQLEVAELTIRYAQAQEAGNNTARLNTLSKIDQALEARTQSLSTLQGLIQTLDQFDVAHDALVRYAKSDKGPQDLSDLVTIVRGYSDSAKDVFDSFKRLNAAASS
ncbi:hypothetical protein HBA54_01080 [Pelagibius litoralis]|uniref:DUF3829 domain-containing protein n=1 Tax=Pelagibius litoralis TaxID=374515 RepID=A0A967C2L6_9PROT|nr:hypothetical protein [Pelagibius litoralis]NIA67179.1 hypothetical protein [Pelagibius litoralis]